MTDQDFQRLTRLLEAIRDNQLLSLERQTEALTLQREHIAMVQRQIERHERIQERAEGIQAKGAQLMDVARKTLFILLPIVAILILYAFWLIFR